MVEALLDFAVVGHELCTQPRPPYGYVNDGRVSYNSMRFLIQQRVWEFIAGPTFTQRREPLNSYSPCWLLNFDSIRRDRVVLSIWQHTNSRIRRIFHRGGWQDTGILRGLIKLQFDWQTLDKAQFKNGSVAGANSVRFAALYSEWPSSPQHCALKLSNIDECWSAISVDLLLFSFLRDKYNP